MTTPSLNVRCRGRSHLIGVGVVALVLILCVFLAFVPVSLAVTLTGIALIAIIAPGVFCASRRMPKRYIISTEGIRLVLPNRTEIIPFSSIQRIRWYRSGAVVTIGAEHKSVSMHFGSETPATKVHIDSLINRKNEK
ncbi:hypothetical protein JIN85_20275 [Luteolibacter pohnpeiensis]|uniref:Uncharacterized protein n=1 Tax=Luteolibacter pohnpeiensis TaxID=454153 RepID=A0A934SB49_9BACT|nr:hypothetical protein [Luteolibacter pohnpeiensis]